MNPHRGIMNQKSRPWDKSPYTEYYDLMNKAKNLEVVEDDDYRVTIDYDKLTTTFEVK